MVRRRAFAGRWFDRYQARKILLPAIVIGLIGIIIAILAVAVFAVLICIISAVSTVSGIKHTNDEDSQA